MLTARGMSISRKKGTRYSWEIMRTKRYSTQASSERRKCRTSRILRNSADLKSWWKMTSCFRKSINASSMGRSRIIEMAYWTMTRGASSAKKVENPNPRSWSRPWCSLSSNSYTQASSTNSTTATSQSPTSPGSRTTTAISPSRGKTSMEAEATKTRTSREIITKISITRKTSNFTKTKEAMCHSNSITNLQITSILRSPSTNTASHRPKCTSTISRRLRSSNHFISRRLSRPLLRTRLIRSRQRLILSSRIIIKMRIWTQCQLWVSKPQNSSQVLLQNHGHQVALQHNQKCQLQRVLLFLTSLRNEVFKWKNDYIMC